MFTMFVRGCGRRSLDALHEMGKMGLFLSTALLHIFLPPLRRQTGASTAVFHWCSLAAAHHLHRCLHWDGHCPPGFYRPASFWWRSGLGPMVGLSLILELGPVLAALMITARLARR